MGRDWTEDDVRRELEAFLDEALEWPSYRDFQRSGTKQLRDAVTQLGGARRWARLTGVRYVERKPGYARRWTDGRVRADLHVFLDGRHDWPMRLEFEHAGCKALRDAVGRLGGPERWAREFSLPIRDLRSGSKRAWTDARIERELRRFLGDRKQWPPRQEFEAADRSDLLRAIYSREGVQHWARRVGVTCRANARPSGPRIWTDERIRAELEEFCLTRATWPSEREFIEAGKARLYKAASRRGGVDRWASGLGVARRRRLSDEG
jgi:hypothetical protein